MRLDNSQWRGHRIELLRCVERRVDDHAIREDIVQEAIARLLTYRTKPGITVANVAALLRRIALDLTRDHFRRSGRTRDTELAEDIPCPQPGIQQRLEQRQLVDLVIDVLRAMPRLRREVFVRRRLDGESSRQVASSLGISPGAVDAHVARAVLDLHRAIDRIERRGGIVRD